MCAGGRRRKRDDFRLIKWNAINSRSTKTSAPKWQTDRLTWNGMDGIDRKSFNCLWQLSIISSRWHTCHRPRRPAFSESKSPTHSVKLLWEIVQNLSIQANRLSLLGTHQVWKMPPHWWSHSKLWISPKALQSLWNFECNLSHADDSNRRILFSCPSWLG